MKLNDVFSLFENREDLITKLNNIAKQLRIPMMVIGGVAVAKHGYVRNTKDIDLVMSVDNAHKFGDHLVSNPEFEFIGDNTFRHSTININICPEGAALPSGGKFPPPESNNIGMHYVSLPHLMSMKIQAKRMKDRADYVELIKRNNIQWDWIQSNVLPRLSKVDARWARALFDEAAKEL